jgi:hypothetical protein
MIAGDILKRALRLAQVFAQGEDPTGTDEETDALSVLNSMLASWSAERLLVPALVTDTLVLTASDGEYTFGTGGDINSARPKRIEYAFIRDSGNNDYPVNIIHAQNYNEITLKSTTGRPAQLYFIAEYPLARIKLYYVPNAAETLHMDSWKPLSSLAAAATTINLPGEYQMALEYNLAVAIAPEYAQTLPRSVYLEAERTKKLIKSLNGIPVMKKKCDPAFFNYGNYGRNIYNDGDS